MPKAQMDPIVVVKLLGSIVEWIASIALIVVFGLMLPLATQRRAVGTWMLGWLGKAVWLTGTALTSLYFIARVPYHPLWLTGLEPISWGSEFVFLAAVTLGSLAATGIRFSSRTHFGVLGVAFAGGLAIWFGGADKSATWIQTIGNIILFFGTAQIILFRARGPRRTGLLVLAATLTLYGILSTVYLLDGITLRPTSSLEHFVHTVSLSSGYGDALMLGILASAVLAVVVREAFIEVAEVNDRRTETITASESRLNGIIQAALEAIITVDDAGRIELVNGAAEEMFGITRAEALGRPLASLLENQPLNLDALFASTRTSDVDPHRRHEVTHTAQARRPDGTVVELEFTIGPLRGEGRSGAVVVLHDLTERNAAQAERKSFEHKMAESEKMLAIGRVVSGVAHELNNPLAVVLGQSEQMVDSAPTAEMRSGLNLIYEQANRARHIVKDLLAFVRHRDEQREPVDLVRLAERTVAAQRVGAVARGMQLQLVFAADMPPVFADRVGVEQILVNLIDNAVDACDAGGTITLTGQVVDQQVELTVADDGAGVSTENIDRIFEPFFTTKGPGRGTGLGLSVSRALAQQQGGSLRLEPPVAGKGARFVLVLPISGTPLPASAASQRRIFPRPPLGADGAAGEVMLIDDEESVRMTLAKMFRRSGWQVREAADGQSALDWLEQVPEAAAPAVILCDLRMPGLDGPGMFERLVRSRPQLAERVVFVTGDVVQSVSSGFIAAAGRLVVEKPFTIDEIASAVEKVIRAAA